MKGPYLEIQTPQGNRQVAMGHRPLTIGRHTSNLVIIGDALASRFHCVIEKKPPAWEIRDLNSSNGTLLDGKPVSRAAFFPGNTVQIGAIRLTLVDPTAPPPEEPEMLTPDDLVEEEDDEPVDELEIVEDANADAPIDVARAAPAATDPEPADDVEELTEADVIDDAGSPDTAAFSPSFRSDDLSVLEALEPVVRMDGDGPIRVAFGRDPHASPAGPQEAAAQARAKSGEQPEAYEQNLQALADSLPNQPFGEDEVALVSARGQVMHAAGSRGRSRRREPVDIFRLLLVICARTRATDIHLEPKIEYFQLRLRIDGLMVDITRLPQDMGVRLGALVKVMCDIDISQRTIVQEGHFSAELPGAEGMHNTGMRRADYRVSFAPAMFGQKLVVRIFDAANAPLKVNDLDLPPKMLDAVKRELQKETGMLLVCGPTGSGKTTTLYALVRSSDVTRRNVVTIEDPIEVQLEGVTQIQTDDAQGKSFGALLRSVLRQDPDAILVGEIRDAETARIAMQAAITGHLVFSTVHTTNSIGSIFRMLDLGVEPYLVAQGLQLVLAQRLVRRLCQFCRRPVEPTESQRRTLGAEFPNVSKVYEPRGCGRCLNTGFGGRQAFFELLTTTDKLRDVIVTTRTMEDIKKAVAETDFVRLEHSGYQLVVDGIASFDEVETSFGR